MAASVARRSLLLLLVVVGMAQPGRAESVPPAKPPAGELRAGGGVARARVAAAAADAALAGGDYERALDGYQRAYMDDIDEPRYLLGLADCYRALGRTSEALRFYRLFLNERPDAPERARVDATVRALEHPAPAAVAVAATSGPAPSAAPERRPVWRRWWLWTAIGGAVAVGVGLGVGLGTRKSGGDAFAPTLPAFGPANAAAAGIP